MTTVPKIQSLADVLGTTPPLEDDTPSIETQTVTVKEFCKAVLSSPEYRRSIIDRITLGSLPPAVECRMYDYAYGKPVEKVEVKHTTPNPLKHLDKRELVAELEALTKYLQEQPADDRVEPAAEDEQPSEDAEPKPPTYH